MINNRRFAGRLIVLIRTALALLIAAPVAVQAAPVDPAVARGKSVLYV